MNCVQKFLDLVSSEKTRLSKTFPETTIPVEAAVRTIAVTNRDLALKVMEEIGSWPSSEPELAALQKVWR